MPLNKVVLHAWDDGSCSLLTVPLSWRPGDVVPNDALDERYDTPAHAMSALAGAGRAQAPTMSRPQNRAKRVPLDAVPAPETRSPRPRE